MEATKPPVASFPKLYPTRLLNNHPVLHTSTRIFELIKRKTTPKPLSSPLNPSSTFVSFKYESFNRKNLNSYPQNDEYRENFCLPFAIDHSGSVSRYLWDGEELRLASVGGNNAFSLKDCITVSVRDFFLPREVSDNYLEYVKWKFLHRVSSSALQVLATQAMFRAIGLGYSRSLPSAAALNWVLKDGLGRLSRCIYTASLASSFDTNLKRVRFSTSVLFSLSIGVELLTPAFPKFFLLLATIANIAKQISLACYLATGTAVHRSFAISDNLGEVSAKSQIQTVCFDNIGLLLAATINILFRNNQRFLAVLPFSVYPIFCGLDLLGIYQGLKHVHLQTLTKDRLVMIMDSWLQSGYVPSPAEVSKREGIDFLWSKGRELLSMRIGCINPKRKIPKLSLLTLRSVKEEDMYFVCLESLNGGSRISDHGILLSLREGAMTSDVIMGLMQSCYVRKGLLLDISDSENSSEPCDSLDWITMKWLTLMEDSRRSLRNDVAILNDEMSKQEWACKNILLSTQEQARYTFITD